MTEPRRASAAELAAIAGRSEGLTALPDRDCDCVDCDVARLFAHIAALDAIVAEREADLCAAVAEIGRLAGEVRRLVGGAPSRRHGSQSHENMSTSELWR